MADTKTTGRRSSAPIKATLGLVEFQQRLAGLLKERPVRAAEQSIIATALTPGGMYTLAMVARGVTITVNADSIRRRNPGMSLEAATLQAEQIQAAMQDIADRSASGIKAAVQDGNAMLLPTPRQIDTLLRWLNLPITEGQLDFVARHAEWLKEIGVGKPMNFAGYARIYRLHSTTFGIGQNNTCVVCQTKFEATAEENAARVAEIDQASKAFDAAVDLDF